MVIMNFVTATNRLTDCPTLASVAQELGVSAGLVRQARMDPSASSYRKPPAGWQAAVARLARKRITELARLADALEPEG
jgi:hypothetical protein